MRDDISDILKRWPPSEGGNVRRIEGEDGRTIIQVRLPLGIEQYELHGRPDGKRPHARESLLDFQEERLSKFLNERETDKGFEFSEEEFRELHEEGILYYYRYLLCYQIGEYDMVLRDTERNIRMFQFVEKYYPNEDARKDLLQYWPYILRMRACAQAFLALAEGTREQAAKALAEAKKRVEELPEIETPLFAEEKRRSLSILGDVIGEIEQLKPVSEKEQLMRKLDKAVAEENYMRAARLRDIIKRMEE